MQNTSQKFKDAIYAPTRMTKGRVTFDISDTTANGDVSSITATSDSPLSVKAQLINKVRNSTYKTATLEQDRFKLDGSFSFPDDTIANNGELGWSSAVICDSSGSFLPTGTINFVGKVSGSTIENPNIAKYQANTALMSPSSGSWGEISTANYSIISSLNAALFLTTYGQNTYMSQHLFSFDLISYMLRTYGLTVDVAWLKANITNLTCNWWGYGSSPTGNKATVKTWWNNSQWSDNAWTNLTKSHTNSTITQISPIVSGGDVNLCINPDGFVHFIAYADPSNGTTASTINTDYVELLISVNLTQTLTFNFTSNHSSAGLTITFDEVNGEYATDFDMTAYNSVGGVIATTAVTGNTDIIATPLGQLLNYRSVSVIIRKWSNPNHRARVMEVDFGIVKQYTDDNLISINLIEQMDMLTGQLPSAEFKFTVDNSDRLFNILNPTGFYKYLQQKQQVIGELGLDLGNGFIEYIPIGNYLLQEWQSDEGSLTASFTARTNLDSMASFDYENLSASTKTLYQFAVDMFTLCGITNYSIDSALSSINTNSLIKKANCRDILQMIAIAGCANIFVTRGNIITLKCNPTLIGAAVDTADFDNMYNEPQIALDKAVKRVEVTYWTNLSTSSIVGVNSTTDTLGDTLKLENNTLINDSTRATAVANWFFAQLKYRATYRINWRGNPATELNDVLSFENSYGGNMSAYVTRNELDYVGYLKARTEAKGVVN